MTLLDGNGANGPGGGGNVNGRGGEVSTLSRPMFHRNGSSNAKKGLASTNFTSDINANESPSNNENFSSNLVQNGVRRVPDICSDNGSGASMHHVETRGDIKKWSDLCKLNSRSAQQQIQPTTQSSQQRASAEVSINGDNNNNHSSDDSGSSSGATTVLPDMDFSN